MSAANADSSPGSKPVPAPSHAPRNVTGSMDGAGWVTSSRPKLLEILRRLLCFPKLCSLHRDLIGTSIKRDLEARFQGTILGWFWPLFQPLFLFVVYKYIFVDLLKFKMPAPEGSGDSAEFAMGVYMFVGVLIWSSVADMLIRGTGAIVDNGDLIKKLAFPTEVLPLNVSLVGVVTMLFGVLVYVPACLIGGLWDVPLAPLIWIPAAVALQCMFAFGLALVLSTLQVFLRDTLQVVTALATVWMFASPIFWAPQLLPGGDKYMGMIGLNPIYHLIQVWRGILMGDFQVPYVPGMEAVAALGDAPAQEARQAVPGGFVSSIDAIPDHLFSFGIWAVGMYVVGMTFFVVAQRRFADEV